MVDSNSTLPDSGTAATAGNPEPAHLDDLITAATELVLTMGTFFEMARREIAEGNSTDFDGIDLLVKGASAEVSGFDQILNRKIDALEEGSTEPHAGAAVPDSTAPADREALVRAENDINRLGLLFETVDHHAQILIGEGDEETEHLALTFESVAAAGVIQAASASARVREHRLGKRPAAVRTA